MAKPKPVSIKAMIKDLPQTLCDMPTCVERAEIIVEDEDFWLCFCPKHNPASMKIVHPSLKKNRKKDTD